MIIIGGSAAGIVTAVTGKSNYPKKEFLVIRQEEQVVVPCGIPYIFGSLDSSDKDVIPDAVLENANVSLEKGTVSSIDREKQLVTTENGSEFHYEKLVLATGSTPRSPKWLKGRDLENVFTIPKKKDYLDSISKILDNLKDVVVIGGGFIGVEVSDELNKKGKNVHLVEILPHVLGLAFDEEIALVAENMLKERGVSIATGAGVKEIFGDGFVEGVELQDGRKIKADAVILAMGYEPNTKLARSINIGIDPMNFIRVDEYMRTEDPNIFAVGDCAEKRDFTTRKLSPVMLASTACSEARVAGMNLYKLSAVKTFSGTIAIFSTAIGNTGFGAAGLTEKQAAEEGFDIITGSFEGVDRHPGALPGTHKQKVKLIVARESGVILGGEVIGGLSAGELINVIGLAIENRMSVNSVFTAQIGTHPLLTAPPTAYPLIKAAESVMKQMKPEFVLR